MDHSLISGHIIDISQLLAGFDTRPEENSPPSENNQRMLVISWIINAYQGLLCRLLFHQKNWVQGLSQNLASIKYQEFWLDWKSNGSNTGSMIRVKSVEPTMFPIIDSQH